MSTHTVMAAPSLPRPRSAPAQELTAAAVGPVPYNWLEPTGRRDQVLTAWGRRQLAEVPVGLSFDTILVPGALARDVLDRVRAAGIHPGPVILGPSGAEVIIRLDSAPGWCAPNSLLLRRGALLLLPPPTVHVPKMMAARSWLIPPAQREASVPPGDGLPSGDDLLRPYLAAVQAAAAAVRLADPGSPSADRMDR
ncbi:hypothetical protein [Streptomyces roseochromogenus]|uniref:Uncharacterized protein n=1 Tax=Streptomyces roseochromogenus subsp. oscitans DS 12.976 TaxID=1352936 RepID=V6JE43_STRRC|nr:hypothetical protein [Streptomyces roseochromogenus]EST17993.1 hypothetical protein M878_45840 [Streptomyces roseochromogenus subsp. oscitans DS 12.976]